MSEITEKEYLEARKVVEAYEKQIANKKLSIYEGCTKEDLIFTSGKDFRGNVVTYYWVTKHKNIPNRNAEGSITYDSKAEFYCLENSTKPYESFEEAKKNLIKTFKRKGYIK